MRPDDKTASGTEAYSLTARVLHWTTLAFLAAIVPIAFLMDGDIIKWSDAVAGRLYDTHKVLGFTLLWLVIARLIYRFSHGAPADEPTLEPWQKIVSHLTHWGIYALLVIVPLLGWSAVSAYGPFEPFGVKLPNLLSHNESLSERLFGIHKLLAFLLILLIAMHIGAALFHYVIRKDGVLNRMWVSLPRRDGK